MQIFEYFWHKGRKAGGGERAGGRGERSAQPKHSAVLKVPLLLSSFHYSFITFFPAGTAFHAYTLEEMDAFFKLSFKTHYYNLTYLACGSTAQWYCTI